MTYFDMAIISITQWIDDELQTLGAGLGASRQTGWTGLVAKAIQLFGLLDPKRVMEGGKDARFQQGT
jgi:hypothetical protein